MFFVRVCLFFGVFDFMASSILSSVSFLLFWFGFCSSCACVVVFSPSMLNLCSLFRECVLRVDEKSSEIESSERKSSGS